MARYCFYCGKELKRGAKCGCRATSQEHQEPEKQQRPASQRAQSVQEKPKQSFIKRIIDYFNPFQRKDPQKNRSGGSQRTNRTSRSSFFRSQKSTRSPVSNQPLLLFITRPVDAIRTVHLSERSQTTGLIFVLNGVLTGLYFYAVSKQPQFRLIYQIGTETGAASPINSWLLLIQGLVIGIASGFLMALLYLLAIRFIFRQSIRYISLLNGISPALIYSALFILASVLVLPSSIISALFTLVAGFGLSAIAQYIAVRRLTSFSDNRCFMLVALVMLFYTSLMALLLNQILNLAKV